MLYSYAFFFAGLGQLLPGQFEVRSLADGCMCTLSLFVC